MRRRKITTCVSLAVCFFFPCSVTSLTVLRLTASSASLIEADKSPWYRRFFRSSLSSAINKRTLNTSKPTGLRIATGSHQHPLRRRRTSVLAASRRYDIYITLRFCSSLHVPNVLLLSHRISTDLYGASNNISRLTLTVNL